MSDLKKKKTPIRDLLIQEFNSCPVGILPTLSVPGRTVCTIQIKALFLKKKRGREALVLTCQVRFRNHPCDLLYSVKFSIILTDVGA